MKYFLLILTLIAIATGILLIPRESAMEEPATQPEPVEEVNCIDMGNRRFYCGDPSTYDDHIKALDKELQSLKTKTIKASITKYSRRDSCHNPSGKKCLTAIGRDTKAGVTVACPRSIKLGTKVSINGHVYTCEDRTAKWVEDKFGGTFDIFTENYHEAVAFGRKTLTVTIL